MKTNYPPKVMRKGQNRSAPPEVNLKLWIRKLFSVQFLLRLVAYLAGVYLPLV
jgi:hypothetical protein